MDKEWDSISKYQDEILQNQITQQQFYEKPTSIMSSISNLMESKERFGHKPSILYRSQIDGLRCLAVIPVILFHYEILQNYVPGGYTGVDVFFVISGYLVNSIIISDLMKNKFTLLTFYERRIRRLFPAIFTTLALILAIGYLMYFQKGQYQQLVQQQIAALGSAINIYFYRNQDMMEDDYFAENSDKWPFLHFWSLAVQQQFYILTPLSLMLLMKFATKNNFLKCMLFYTFITIGISLVMSILLTESDQMFAFYLLPCRAWELGLGGFIAILLHQQTIIKVGNKVSKWKVFKYQIVATVILQIFSWMGLAMILMSYYTFNKQDNFPGYKAMLPCGGASLYIATNFVRYQKKELKQRVKSDEYAQETINIGSQFERLDRKMLKSAKILSFDLIIWIGQISYSLYLWHWPVWIMANHYIEGQLTFVHKLICILIVFNLAYLSTQFIENPIRNKKKVSTKVIWIGFAFIWACFMALLVSNIYYNIGGKEIQFETWNNTDINSTSYFDSQGFMLQNPYRSLSTLQVSLLQNIEQPQFTPVDHLIYIREGQKLPQQPVFINYENKDQPLCLALLGTSHTEQHVMTLKQLAQQYNVSMGSLAWGSFRSQFYYYKNQLYWDKWRINKLKELKPKIIFTSFYWFYRKDNTQKRVKSFLDPLMQLPNPPKLIVVFGDNPLAGFGTIKKINMDVVLKQKYYQNNGWQFLENLHQPTLQQQIIVEKLIADYISENYDSNIVKFYPNLYQFFIDHETGVHQIFGSQVNGKLLYKDFNHVTQYGSRRLKLYFQDKIFKRALELCKQQ